MLRVLLRGATAAGLVCLAAQAKGRPAGQAPAALSAPVAGAIIRGFGTVEPDGPASGITYAASPRATVSAPCQGRIVFAAPFRSYGRLIILHCAGGRDIIMSGLASLAGRPGQAVRSGERLGRMPDGAGPGLYVELRAGGVPVDPVPFLKAGS